MDFYMDITKGVFMKKEYILNTEITDSQLAIFYLGQEGYLFKYRNTTILIDPYLSDYVDKNCCTDTVKWIRNYPAPILAEELDFIDYCICTHTHYDHMDPCTLQKLAKVNPETIFIVPDFATELVNSYGISNDKIIGAVANSIIECGDCKVCPIPSAHEELHLDKNGNYMELGYKILFDTISVYHGGDCCLYDGLAETLKNIDVMMVPINGRSYYKLKDDIIGNMTIEEAVLLAKICHADMLIPMHYDLYSVNCVNPANFVDYLYTNNPTQKFHMFVPGERFIYTSL